MPRRRDREHSGPQTPGQRQLRVGEELRHLLAELLRPGELRDPALRDANITVTEVRLSPDLRNATAFVMPLGGANAEEIMAGLRRSAPVNRGSIASTAAISGRMADSAVIAPSRSSVSRATPQRMRKR